MVGTGVRQLDPQRLSQVTECPRGELHSSITDNLLRNAIPAEPAGYQRVDDSVCRDVGDGLHLKPPAAAVNTGEQIPLCAVASGQLNSDSRTVTGPATLSSVSSGEFPDQENTSSEGWCCAVRSNMGKHRRSAQVLCFYHQRFGNKANKCEGQCSWKNQAQGNASRARRH